MKSLDDAQEGLPGGRLDYLRKNKMYGEAGEEERPKVAWPHPLF